MIFVIVSALIFLVSLVGMMDSQYGGLSILGLLPGVGGFISGLLLVITGQLTRAMVDTADNTGKMLNLMNINKEE